MMKRITRVRFNAAGAIALILLEQGDSAPDLYVAQHALTKSVADTRNDPVIIACVNSVKVSQAASPMHASTKRNLLGRWKARHRRSFSLTA